MSRPQLWFGSRGPDVVYLQRRLQARRLYRLAEGDEAGLFGSATEMSVKALQAMYGLRESGVVGEHTWAIIEADQNEWPVEIRAES